MLLTPTPAEFDDVELALGGALAEVQIELSVGAGPAPDTVELTDEEGTSVALLAVTARLATADATVLHGTVTALRPHESGRFAGLRRPAREVAAAIAKGTLGIATNAPLTPMQVAAVRALADAGAPLVLLGLVGTGRPHPLRAEALLRTLTEATGGRPGVQVVAVPLRARPDLPVAQDAALLTSVAAAYGIGQLRTPTALADIGWSSPGELPALPVLDRELRRVQPGPGGRGAVVLFTGLSGSGKSTVARAVADVLAEEGTRTVTLLDGDAVRRNLSTGLGFSRTDRDRNVARIGYVAALIAEHGGIALAAPIAPYAATRAAVRRRANAVGDFVLVHISTPLEVCEARDRKGLYARARRGEIPEFTGISDPYEVPTDADLVLDTSVVAIPDAVGAVLDRLGSLGHLGAPSAPWHPGSVWRPASGRHPAGPGRRPEPAWRPRSIG